jgi:hypothetical protein
MPNNKWKQSDGRSPFNETVTALASKTSELVDVLVNQKLGELKLAVKKIENKYPDKEKLKKITKLVDEIQVKHRTWESKT